MCRFSKSISILAACVVDSLHGHALIDGLPALRSLASVLIRLRALESERLPPRFRMSIGMRYRLCPIAHTTGILAPIRGANISLAKGNPMNRRTFIAQVGTLPLAASIPAPCRALSRNPPSTNPVLKAGPDLSRYRLTLGRVLSGTGPSYTPDFLLEDILATPGRRFTKFSGDLSGRWIGALSIRGTLDLYQFTGNPSHLNQVIAVWKDVQNSGDTLITGGVPERWTPKRERTGGCAECD